MLKTHLDASKGIIYGVIAAVIWGAWPVVSVLGNHANLQASDLTALRFGVAGCLLLPILLFNKVKLRNQWKKGIALSIGAGVPYVLIALTGLNYAPSSHFGIITPSSMLIFTSIGSYFWLRETTNTTRWVGLFLIFIGISIVGIYSVTRFSLDHLMGDLMFICCGFLWASYTLLSRYWSMNPWVATAQVSVISMIVYLPIYFLFVDHNLAQLPWKTLVYQGIFQGTFVAIFALYFYSKAVAILGSAKGAIFSALVPLISLLLGSVLLNEGISSIEYIGLGTVCLGMLFAFELLKISPKLDQRLLSRN